MAPRDKKQKARRDPAPSDRERSAAPDDEKRSPLLAHVGVTNTTKAMSAVGVLAAVALAVFVNLIAARHYRRIDYTSTQLYTLSPATIATLHSLQQNITFEVLLATSDPLFGSVQSLLVTYGGETTRIKPHFVSPDRSPAEFLAVQQKYGIVAGKTEDNKVVTDAAIVVAAGDRHWFITSSEMVEVAESEEGRNRSRIEQAFTGAIRAVIGGEKIRVCSSVGHGEYSLDDPSPQGLGELRERLLKNNYAVTSVDGTRPDARDAFKDCDVLVIAGPMRPFLDRERDEILARTKAGMGALLLMSPMLEPDRKTYLATNLEPVLQQAGIGLPTDVVFEQEPEKRLPKGVGEAFFPEIKSHSITEGLSTASQLGLRILVVRTRSLSVLPTGARPTELLAASAGAYGMNDFFGWVERGGEPKKRDTDRAGPFPIALASELPKPEGAPATRGARIVAFGTANIALGQNWQEPPLRGNALLIENAMSWIASRPPILDVPARQVPAGTLHITEGSLSEIARYVLLFMPGAAALMGLAVYLVRRRREQDTAARKGAT